MPSLNRPNAPSRLPSANFGSLFNKPRGVRGSELSVSTSSPLSTPSNVAQQRRTFRSSDEGAIDTASPLSSPLTTPMPRRPIYVERYSYRSDTSVAPSYTARNEVHLYDTIPDEGEEEAPPPLKKRKSSSVSNRARKFLSISASGIDSANKGEQPPREAKNGFEWKRDFLGGWLEIRLGRRSDGRSSTASEGNWQSHDTQGPAVYEPSFRLSRRVSTGESALLSGVPSNQPLMLEDSDEFDDTPTILKEGLYCRTRRALGLKRGPIISGNPVPRTRTPTANILDRVSSTLKLVNVRRETSDSTATSVSNMSIAGPRWQRFRPSRNLSTSSSIRELMMGKPPIPTPEPELMYIGSDSRQYLAVEMSEPANPSYLPSEARRITTPPLINEGPNSVKPRGFFFDYSAPDAENSARNRGVREREAFNGTTRHGSVSDMDWYRVKLDAIESDGDARELFVSSIPDHLPNSPLCPRNVKHKSAGLGICPIHGKNKTSAQSQTPTPKEDMTNSALNWWYEE